MDPKVHQLAQTILMLQLFSPSLLSFAPSQIAAVALILAVNINKLHDMIEQIMRG